MLCGKNECEQCVIFHCVRFHCCMKKYTFFQTLNKQLQLKWTEFTKIRERRFFFLQTTLKTFVSESVAVDMFWESAMCWGRLCSDEVSGLKEAESEIRRTFEIALQLSIDSIVEELLKLPHWKKWSKPERGMGRGGSTGTGEFWSVMKEKGEKGVKVVFSLTEWRWRCVCVFGLSFFGPENKIHLARSLHLSQRNNTNSISPCRVIRSVIYRFSVQICTLGNCFVVLQQRWHTGLSLHSRQHHSPFQCVPTLAKSMLASVAVMEMCTLTKPITQWVVKSDGVLLCTVPALVEKVPSILCMCYLSDSCSTSKLVRHL